MTSISPSDKYRLQGDGRGIIPLPTKRENALKWIAALRSGEYKQGRAYLNTDDKFCCLGVACDISGLGEWKYPPTDSTLPAESVKEFILTEDKDKDTESRATFVGLPPQDVFNLLGLTHCTDTITVLSRFNENDGYLCNVIWMNDNGFTFSQIADVIQAWLNGWDLLMGHDITTLTFQIGLNEKFQQPAQYSED